MFKTKPLNRVFLRIYAPLAWFNFHDYALSHTYHHRYTLHPDGDREVVLPQSPTLRWLYVLQLLTINITGGPMCRGLWPILRYTVTAALGLPMRADTVGDTEPVGVRAQEWIAALYEAHPEERRKSIRWAQILLLFHGSVLVVAIALQLWLLPVLIILPVAVANWWRLPGVHADALRPARQYRRLPQMRAQHQDRPAVVVPVLAHELAHGASHVRGGSRATTCAS